MSVGNVLGSNLLNVLFVVGLVALIRPLRVDPEALTASLPGDDRLRPAAVAAGVDAVPDYPDRRRVLLAARRLPDLPGVFLTSSDPTRSADENRSFPSAFRRAASPPLCSSHPARPPKRSHRSTGSFSRTRARAAGKATVPEAGYLDARAQRRRARRGSEAHAARRDAPLAPAYLEEVKALGAEPLVESRWLNAVSARLRPEQVADGPTSGVGACGSARRADGRADATEASSGGWHGRL